MRNRCVAYVSPLSHGAESRPAVQAAGEGQGRAVLGDGVGLEGTSDSAAVAEPERCDDPVGTDEHASLRETVVHSFFPVT